MLKHYMNKVVVCVFASAGLISLGALHGVISSYEPQNAYRPQSNPPPQQASGREEMAYVDSYDRPGYRSNDQGYYNQQNTNQGYYNQQSNNRSSNNQQNNINRYDVAPSHPMTDWDYKESWQYNQKDYFQGKTQAETYRDHHPYGYGGIGYDADPEYLKMEQMEKEYYHQKQQIDNLLSEKEKKAHPQQSGQYNQIPNTQNKQSIPDQTNNSKTQADTDAKSDSGIAATDRDQRRATRERKNRKAYQNPRVIPPTKKPDQ